MYLPVKKQNDHSPAPERGTIEPNNLLLTESLSIVPGRSLNDLSVVQQLTPDVLDLCDEGSSPLLLLDRSLDS